VLEALNSLWVTPVPADMRCTSPGRMIELVPMLSLCWSAPSSTYEMISMSRWECAPKPCPDCTRSSLITRSARNPMCAGS
jgi:hypothetical protein